MRAQRKRGSHHVYRHPDHPDRRVVIVGSEGTDVPTDYPGSGGYDQAGIILPAGDEEAPI